MTTTFNNLIVTGTFTYPGAPPISASNWGDYLYWNGFAWAVGSSNITIGSYAGQTNQYTNAVALGFYAGNYNQASYAVAIGANSGQTNQGISAIAIGNSAGYISQGQNTIAIGFQSGSTAQGSGSVAIGYLAGQHTQGTNAVAIGPNAGRSNQGTNAVAIGNSAGSTAQGLNAVAFGAGAGQFYQGSAAIAIGGSAGAISQGTNAIAIGTGAGQTNQGTNAIAIGYNAGNRTQGQLAIAIGSFAGSTGQGTYAIAIGNGAGFTSQSSGAIAIGLNAGFTNQAANSIVIFGNNSAGSYLNGITANATYISPIRIANASGFTSSPYLLMYDATSREIGYSSATTSPSKTFVIDHPIKKGRLLVHACMEGPEVGVYYRGSSRVKDLTVIKLPDYTSCWTEFTMHLTPIGTFAQMYYNLLDDNSFEVHSTVECSFSWVVYAKRGSIEVEPLKETTNVKGSGPYRWIDPSI